MGSTSNTTEDHPAHDHDHPLQKRQELESDHAMMEDAGVESGKENVDPTEHTMPRTRGKAKTKF